MKAVALSVHPWIIRLLCTYAFILPFSSKFAAIVLFALVLCCIVYKVAVKSMFRFTSFTMFWIMAFYVAHLTGLINTTDFNYASLDLQIKLSFLLIPLFIDNIPVSEFDFRRITRSFLAGCTLLLLVLLLNAILEYLTWHDPASFFYIDFCSVQHVAYLTLYTNLAIFFLFDEFFRLPGTILRNRFFLGVWAVFLFLTVLLMSSRTAIAATVITLPVYIYLTSASVDRRTMSVLTTSIALLTMAVIYFSLGKVNDRLSEYKAPAPVEEVSASQADESSSVAKNIRYEVWKNTLQLASTHLLFGTGTGDVKNDLLHQYELTNFTEARKLELNPHNQFLHTLLALGIPGLILLLLLFYKPFRSALCKKNYLLLAFLSACICNMLTESMLEKQAGVLFIVFFLVLLSGRSGTKPLQITEA